MDKKLGLEHTIRLLMSESIGAIGTDKFKPVANSFFRPVHIAPSKGGGHSNGSSAVRAARNVQKQKTSETMQEEEQLDEFLAPVVKGAELGLKYGDEALELLGKALKPVEKLPVKPAKKVPAKPFKEPPAPAKPKDMPLAPESVPAKPETLPAVRPEVKPVTKPETLPAVKPEVKPATKPETLPAVKPETMPSVKPETVPATKPSVQPKTQTQTETLPKPQTQTKTKTENLPKPLPAPIPPKAPPPKDSGKEPERSRKRTPFSFPTLSIDPVPLTGLRGYVPIKPFMHYAKERVDEEMDADTERKKIEAVPRPNGSKNRTRQAEIIRKIIEEKKHKKKKDDSTVIINPEINSPELDKT